jgi:hypothetical protein
MKKQRPLLLKKNTSLSTSVAKYLSGLTLSEFKTLKGLKFERVVNNN